MSIGVLKLLNCHRVILASQSPRRACLLEQIGVRFQQVSSGFDEEKMLPDESVKEFVVRLAKLKAKQAASSLIDSGIIIGADTVVLLNEKILGKPNNKSEAMQFLQNLSGKTHRVYTGLTLLFLPQQKLIEDFCITDVTFRELDKEEINDYVNNEYVYDKAGGYGIQDAAGLFIEKINGCYYNVMGFPLTKFYQMVQRLLSSESYKRY